MPSLALARAGAGAAQFDAAPPDLLGRVLERLPPRDVRAARLAARALDDAARAQLARAATLTLTPANAAAGAAPNWARFPRLRRLVLVGWQSASDSRRLENLFDDLASCSAVAALAAVTDVAFVRSDRLGAAALAAVLRRTPGAARIGLPALPQLWAPGADGAQQLAVLSGAAAAAPRLRELRAPIHAFGAAAAAAVARLFPALEALSVGSLAVGGAPAPGAWAALPCGRLTALRFGLFHCEPIPPAVTKGLHWPRLRELAGVELPAEQAAALAQGLPGLEALAARPTGAWPPRPAAVFPRVARASLTCCCESFGAVHLAGLLPSLRELVVSVHKTLDADLRDLTRLSSLAAFTSGQPSHAPPSAERERLFDALRAMPRLRRLALSVGPRDAPLLARLPPALEALKLSVCPFAAPSPWGAIGPLEGIDLGAVLQALSGLTALSSVDLSGPTAAPRAAARAPPRAGPPRLRALAVGAEVGVEGVRAIAECCRLERLTVQRCALSAPLDEPAVQRLAAECAASGPSIKVADARMFWGVGADCQYWVEW
ncbi:MAG: hypothetical protein J3K34DRAFT_521959 [Monoraphidium minutum]|nr:MAG: hypothetical protein J3K34DRAFT_521959 [Monoraphidium minutum]